MVQTTRYVRKPFYIDAVQVTDANINDVAKWCGGEVRTADNSTFVKVRVHRPLNERQTQAFPGDWVLYAGTGFKVYTPKAFNKSFVLARDANKDEPVELRVTETPADGTPALPRTPVPSTPVDPVPTS
jgi:hypothetical protein